MERATLSDILREVSHAPELQDRLARIVYGLGGGRVPFSFTSTVLGSPAAAAETAIATVPAFNPPTDSSTMIVLAYYQVIAGTSSTSATTRFRMGSGLTGTQLFPTSAVTVVATSTYLPFLMAIDTTALQAGIQYTMSAQMAAATAVSTVSFCAMLALALG